MDGKGFSTCVVCGETSDQVALHYSRMLCNGCRAFFKRTIQGKVKLTECKASGRCTVDPSSRKACKACRFDACMKAGVDSTKVQQPREGAHDAILDGQQALQFHMNQDGRPLHFPVFAQPPSPFTPQSLLPRVPLYPRGVSQTAPPLASNNIYSVPPVINLHAPSIDIGVYNHNSVPGFGQPFFVPRAQSSQGGIPPNPHLLNMSITLPGSRSVISSTSESLMFPGHMMSQTRENTLTSFAGHRSAFSIPSASTARVYANMVPNMLLENNDIPLYGGKLSTSQLLSLSQSNPINNPYATALSYSWNTLQPPISSSSTQLPSASSQGLLDLHTPQEDKDTGSALVQNTLTDSKVKEEIIDVEKIVSDESASDSDEQMNQGKTESHKTPNDTTQNDVLDTNLESPLRRTSHYPLQIQNQSSSKQQVAVIDNSRAGVVDTRGVELQLGKTKTFMIEELLKPNGEHVFPNSRAHSDREYSMTRTHMSSAFSSINSMATLGPNEHVTYLGVNQKDTFPTSQELNKNAPQGLSTAVQSPICVLVTNSINTSGTYDALDLHGGVSLHHLASADKSLSRNEIPINSAVVPRSVLHPTKATDRPPGRPQSAPGRIDSETEDSRFSAGLTDIVRSLDYTSRKENVTASPVSLKPSLENIVMQDENVSKSGNEQAHTCGADSARPNNNAGTESVERNTDISEEKNKIETNSSFEDTDKSNEDSCVDSGLGNSGSLSTPALQHVGINASLGENSSGKKFIDNENGLTNDIDYSSLEKLDTLRNEKKPVISETESCPGSAVKETALNYYDSKQETSDGEKGREELICGPEATNDAQLFDSDKQADGATASKQKAQSDKNSEVNENIPLTPSKIKKRLNPEETEPAITAFSPRKKTCAQELEKDNSIQSPRKRIRLGELSRNEQNQKKFSGLEVDRHKSLQAADGADLHSEDEMMTDTARKSLGDKIHPKFTSTPIAQQNRNKLPNFHQLIVSLADYFKHEELITSHLDPSLRRKYAQVSSSLSSSQSVDAVDASHLSTLSVGTQYNIDTFQDHFMARIRFDTAYTVQQFKQDVLTFSSLNGTRQEELSTFLDGSFHGSSFPGYKTSSSP